MKHVFHRSAGSEPAEALADLLVDADNGAFERAYFVSGIVNWLRAAVDAAVAELR